MNRVLTESEVAILGSGGPRKFSTSCQAEGLPNSRWTSDREELPGAFKTLGEAGVRARLVEQWRQLHKGAGKKGDFASPLQAQFFAYCEWLNMLWKILLRVLLKPFRLLERRRLFLKPSPISSCYL
jgi:hypothetical protein